MTEHDRDLFDRLFERVFAGLPERLRALVEQELVVIIDDEPTDAMLDDIERDEGERPAPDGLLGLHTGVPLTEWSVEDHGREPTTIHLFRLGLITEATDEAGLHQAELERQIRITLLHEIGHHFGLDEDDLAELGYG